MVLCLLCNFYTSYIYLIVFRPLFAPSLLGIVQTLLDQTQEDDMRILGCLMLVDFLNSKVSCMVIYVSLH